MGGFSIEGWVVAEEAGRGGDERGLILGRGLQMKDLADRRI